MPNSGIQNSPRLVKGTLVQLTEDIVGMRRKVIPFQYNPDKLQHRVTPWSAGESDQSSRGSTSPDVQPTDLGESFTLSLELDAADDLEDSDTVAVERGISDRIAALKKLLLPTRGLNVDLVATARSLAAGNVPNVRAARPTVPVCLFAWGPGRILPVRITSFSVDETLFSPTLYPLQATVSLGLRVLTPDAIRRESGPAKELANAAYNLAREQVDELAEGHAGNVVNSVRGAIESFL